MKCPTCGHENPVGASFCEECGARLQPACPACGSEVSPTARFCRACGSVLAAPATVPAGALSAAPPQSHTPPHLAEKILTSRGALEGERKQVTVLFADLKGSMELLADRDPEEARTILDGVLQRMMEAVHRYEGTVNQVMGDGIMALFGAPIAHEDHAVRACYAALAMQQTIRAYAEELQRSHGLFVHIRVGLNSGEVVVRSIGSDLHMDYSAVGQTTSLAARMEQMAAPGSTLMASATVQLVEGYVQVRPLGPVQVKGIDEPLEVYEVLGAGRARTRLQAAAVRGLTRFVGRDAEMETLRQAVERGASGHGQVAAIVGEPGVGKSRLVYELVHSHRTHGWLALEAGSISYGRATPYLPVTDLLKTYFRIEPQDDERRMREKVAGKVLTLDEALRPYLPAYRALLAVSTDDPAWRELEPAQRSQQTLQAVRRLLLRESQVQPLLLVFEDLHWIDGETQALLDGLVESIPSARVLLLVNYRPEYRHSWGSKTYYAQVRLDPLGPESADELLGALLGDDAGLEPLKALLIQRTEGNPFFLEESVRTLVETVALAGERGGYRLVRPVESTQVPATVQAMLAARIDRLAAEEKRLLQSAGVIGKDVPYVLLRAIAEEPEGQLRERLVHLQGAEFLYEASLFPEVEYTFKHALTHEVAYGSLLQERRRALHARIVEAMERVYIGRLVDHVERLGHHSVRGEQWGKAVAYLQEASAKATAQSAYAEAVRLLEQALEVQERLDPTDRAARCDLLLALAEALGPAGEPQKAAEEVAPAAFALAEELRDRGRLARCSQIALDSVGRYGAGALGGSPIYHMWVERFDRYAEPGTIQRAQADLALWSTRFLAGQWAEARAGVARALELARSLDDPGLLFTAVGLVMQPGFSSARHQPEALRLAEEISRRKGEGVSVGALASALGAAQMVYLEWSQRPRAEELWRELEALASRTQDPAVLLWPLECEAIRANLEGDLEAAVEAGQRLVARGEELGSAVAGRYAAENLTFWPLLYLGRAGEALGALGGAQRMAGLRGTTFRGGRTGLCLAQMGNIAEARSELRDALQRFNVSPEEDEMFSSPLTDLLHTAVMVEDLEAAALLAHRLPGVTAVGYSRHTLTNVARALGRAAALLGDPAAARPNYERSLEWATAIRHRPEIALTRLELAELLLSPLPLGEGKGEGVPQQRQAEAQAHLDFAIAEFRAMKMQPALERALRQKSLLGRKS